jgi:dihydrofolate reductase
MEGKNSVFIATSLDGYIADSKGGLDWLQSIPNPENSDMGYGDFIQDIDALVMGRKTFETVCSFDMEWPYKHPVFVMSNTLKTIPEPYENKAQLVKGSPQEIVAHLNNQGYYQLYIDGGVTIQSFLREGLIDDLVVTTMPILLGGGSPLFSDLPDAMEFQLVESKVYLNQIVQSHYRKVRN